MVMQTFNQYSTLNQYSLMTIECK